MGSILKQAQDAMERAKQMEEELKLLEVVAEKQGVTVKANGSGDILSLKVDKQLIDPEDAETLEDAVLMAIRDALDKSKQLRESKMREIAGGLNLPGGLGF
jgi:DNA-binding YbaB/EbfC family protein